MRPVGTAALLVLAIHEPEWETQVGNLIAGFENTWVVRAAVMRFLFHEFDATKTRSLEEDRVKKLLLQIYLAGYTFENDRHRRAVGAAFVQRLDSYKLKARGSKSSQSLELEDLGS